MVDHNNHSLYFCDTCVTFLPSMNPIDETKMAIYKTEEETVSVQSACGNFQKEFRVDGGG